MQDETIQVVTYNGKPLVPPKDLYKMLGGAISLPNIYDLCHREGFPCLHIGKKLLVPVQAAYEWFQQQKN
ncbi:MULTISPECIES: helix-turn-helix domain-containing protein [Caproicibacterium]|uniref:DNA-binding protein n=1 Tax=Caproicibacterium lactatifermentans TaxID=2666138 RepID=A0A859DMU2_9FIRM|nr:helix-turn-helix domain-containing protein [Caproicibacterium lactatifermentans]QKN23158.1 hypothetical protein GJQ69_00825 [Caproicibacterium lactatifermentans]